MLLISLLLQLLSSAVTLRRDKSVLYSRTSINILIYCIYSNFIIRKSIKAIGLFGGLFHFTSITKIYQIFFYIICVIILQLTSYYPRKLIFSPFTNTKSFITNKMSEQFKILEYSLIISFIISGAIFLMSSSDLISMFLSIELQSYGLYILTTIYKNSEYSTKGGLTYFLLGGLSSCFILLGSCLLYSNTGTTNLDGIYVITSLTSNISLGFEDRLISCLSLETNYINISLIIMTVGFLFKVSAAPFHFWSPDVYDAIPTIVTTFVAIVGKISIFIFLLELLHYTGRDFLALGTNISSFYSINKDLISMPLGEYSEFTWVNVLLLSCLLSLIIGSVLGLSQNRIKRLFAYSTISHIGFILLALSIDSLESIQAFLFYLMQYSLSNLNAFIILISIGYVYYFSEDKLKNDKAFNENLEDKKYSPIQLTKQVKGLFFINPVLALSLTITIFSFVGIPPLLGFFGKQMVLSAALDSGYYFITIIAIVTSVISAVYYLNIIKEMFFFKPDSIYFSLSSYLEMTPKKMEKYRYILANGEANGETRNINNLEASSLTSMHPKCFNKFNLVLSSFLTITISILTLGVILFIFAHKEWLSMVNVLTQNLNNI